MTSVPLKLQPGRNFLMHSVLCSSGIMGLSVIKVDEFGKVDIEPFSGEIHSTAWADGIGILLKVEAVTDFLLDDMEMIYGRYQAKINDPQMLSALDNYLRASSLYAPPGCDYSDCALISFR